MKASNVSLSFEGQQVHFGLDVHKKSWAVYTIHGEIKSKPYTIVDPTAIELHRRLHLQYPEASFVGVYEAGFCGFHLIRELKLLGIELHAVNAADVPLTHKDRLQKDDPRDARRLATMVQNHNYEPIYVPSKEQEFFRQLVRRRGDLVKSTTRIQNKIKGHLYFTGLMPQEWRFEDWRLGKARLEVLEQLALDRKAQQGFEEFSLLSMIGELRAFQREKKQVTKQIQEVITQCHDELYQRLLTCPGVGPVTAFQLIGELFTIDRFASADHLASYVGLIPTRHSSGEQENIGSMSCRQNKRVRTAMIEAAWRAISADPGLGLYFNEQVKQRKTGKNKAIVKVARKLLNRVRYVWRSGNNYENNIG